MKVGLVLGGGGARGLAHVGVIKVLEKAGIAIDYISGTSMGALIGAIYAQHPDAQKLEEKVVNFIKSSKYEKIGVDNLRQKQRSDPDDILAQLAHQVKRRLIINLAANRIALLKAERLTLAVNALLEDRHIEECEIPFACVATDLLSGNEAIFDSGKIRPAVSGSSAIPGFIPPVHYNGYLLIDGSVVNNFPMDILRAKGAEFVIAVDVSLHFEADIEIKNVIDLVMRTNQITTRKLNTLLQKNADYLIQPEIGEIHWSEFRRVDELIHFGEQATENALRDIRKLRRKGDSFFKRMFRQKN
jgi:NTE family protein